MYLTNFLQFCLVWPLISHDFRHLAVKTSCGIPRLDDENRGKKESIPQKTRGNLFFTTEKKFFKRYEPT